MKRKKTIEVVQHWGNRFITMLLVLNMVVVGLLTEKTIKQDYGSALLLFCDVSAVIFLLEMLVRVLCTGKDFWIGKDKRWNWFDLIITVISSASLFFTSNAIVTLRMFRQFRILRIFSEFKNLRSILDGLMDSVSKLAWTSIFFFVMYYIYAVIGIDFYGEKYPQWFDNIGTAMFTLFQLMTLEGWVSIAETVMVTHPWAWIYFMSFILIVSYILINLIVGIIVSSLKDKVDDEKNEAMKAEIREIVKELKNAKE